MIVAVFYLACFVTLGVLVANAPLHDIETCPPECFCHTEWAADRARR